MNDASATGSDSAMTSGTIGGTPTGNAGGGLGSKGR